MPCAVSTSVPLFMTSPYAFLRACVAAMAPARGCQVILKPISRASLLVKFGVAPFVGKFNTMGNRPPSSRVTLSASSLERGASTKPMSAPEALAILMRSIASSKPCVCSESVRAMSNGAEGLLDLEAAAACILCAHSARETTSLPPRCPHRLGLTMVRQIEILLCTQWKASGKNLHYLIFDMKCRGTGSLVLLHCSGNIEG